METSSREKNDEEDCEDTMSSDGSDEDVVECEDEDEFEEVMRVLGLQPVSFTPNGDLQLPNGNVAGGPINLCLLRAIALVAPSRRPSSCSQVARPAGAHGSHSRTASRLVKGR